MLQILYKQISSAILDYSEIVMDKLGDHLFLRTTEQNQKELGHMSDHILNHISTVVYILLARFHV